MEDELYYAFNYTVYTELRRDYKLDYFIHRPLHVQTCFLSMEPQCRMLC